MDKYKREKRELEPEYPLRDICFRNYIAPLLKSQENIHHLSTFLTLGYSAWRLGIKEDDLRRASFIQAVCFELLNTNETIFCETLSIILSQIHNTFERYEAEATVYYSHRGSKDLHAKLASTKDFYRTLFENDFRLWITLPYLYACKVHDIKTKAMNSDGFVHTSASTKFNTLKNNTIPSPYGNIEWLLQGFDNQIRNAGGGHEDWEVNDDGEIVFYIRAPRSGKLNKTVIYSDSKFENIVKECQKTIWVLQVGVLVFLENNKQILNKLSSKKKFKISEIKSVLHAFANDRWFDIIELSIENERSKVSITLQHSPRSYGIQQSIFFGTRQAYDIIQTKVKAILDEQVFGIIQCLLGHFDQSNMPEVYLKILDKNGSIVADVEYDSTEMNKLKPEHSKKLIRPVPRKGDIPYKQYYMIMQLRFPYGTRKLAEEICRKKGYELYTDLNTNLDLLDINENETSI